MHVSEQGLLACLIEVNLNECHTYQDYPPPPTPLCGYLSIIILCLVIGSVVSFVHSLISVYSIANKTQVFQMQHVAIIWQQGIIFITTEEE